MSAQDYRKYILKAQVSVALDCCQTAGSCMQPLTLVSSNRSLWTQDSRHSPLCSSNQVKLLVNWLQQWVYGIVVKPLLVMPVSVWDTLFGGPALPLLIQIPVLVHTGKQQVTAQVVWILSSMWNICAEFLVPGSNPAQTWLLWALGEWNIEKRLSLLSPLFLSFCLSMIN